VRRYKGKTKDDYKVKGTSEVKGAQLKLAATTSESRPLLIIAQAVYLVRLRTKFDIFRIPAAYQE
jgi:hypothetical protein